MAMEVNFAALDSGASIGRSWLAAFTARDMNVPFVFFDSFPVLAADNCDIAFREHQDFHCWHIHLKYFI